MKYIIKLPTYLFIFNNYLYFKDILSLQSGRLGITALHKLPGGIRNLQS
jgi:hypothetical protein